MGLYSRHLGQTLKAQLTEFLDAPHGVQTQLFEELALARTQAVIALKLYEAGMDSKEERTKVLAHSLLKDALNHVRDMCLAVSRIEAAAADKVSIATVDLFIVQVVRAVGRVVKDDETTKAIEKEIRDTVRLPTSKEADVPIGSMGTELTPDMEVLAMDERSSPNVEGQDHTE